MEIIAGVDEVGRGPLAGPVIAAAVVLDPENRIEGLADSKKLSSNRREELASIIKKHAISWAIGRADVAEIDKINILQASLLAMSRAVDSLTVDPTLVLVDGNKLPKLNCKAEAIIKGDTKIAEISAASIVAKVSRDAEMLMLDKQYPGYGLAQHKGYPTKAHMQALQDLGVTEIHRTSFKPVVKLLFMD